MNDSTTCRRSRLRLAHWLLALLLLGSLLPLPAAGAQSAPTDVEAVLEAMTAADKVGQLFVVSFVGDDLSPNSDIAELIRDYRVGGVLLTASNGNFRNFDPDGNPANTPELIVRLTNQLQALAFDGDLPTDAALAPEIEDVRRLTVPEDRGVTLPLLIGVDHEGDGFPYTRLFSGFTPLPSNMALGATWSANHAATVGRIVGEELSAVGINLLLGPSLDVLDRPRPDPKASLGIRSFGGNPYWVGRLGRAYIGGVHEGSAGQLATVAKHFPGQGSSDRLPDDEVATIQKSLPDLQAIELAPFAAAVRPGTLDSLLTVPSGPAAESLEAASQASTVTDGLLSTHVRYAALQGSSEGTPPISLASQLTQELLNSPTFSEWRRSGQGVVMSDGLGALAIRRYYDPTLQDFPHKRVAQEALLAGNDLLTMTRFAITDNWPDQLANMKETIEFFRDKYESDDDFRRRVDAAVLRILNTKARLYPELNLRSTLVDGSDIASREGQHSANISQIARDAVTLIGPSPAELAERLPAGPGPNDTILIFTDARVTRECFSPECPLFPLISATALEDIILRLYGPAASGQMTPARIRSLTFDQLSAFLAGQPTTPANEEIQQLIDTADWLVFAMLDEDPNFPSSSALRQFLSQQPVSRERKRLVAISYSAPYFLGATDIAKLTAYFGVYAKTQPFLEASVRALFREFTPTGASPVDIPGANYSLAEKLRPDPTQSIAMQLPDVRVQVGSNTFTAAVGDTLRVVAGPILDYNGRLVPDGTQVSFKLRQRSDQFELLLEETGTMDGFAEASVILERPGDFEVRVESGQASGSLSFILSIENEAGGEAQVAVSTPTATSAPEPSATPTPTETPSPTPTETPTPVAEVTPVPAPPLPPRRVDAGAFALALASVISMALAGFVVFGAGAQVPEAAVRNMLLVCIGGLVAYSLYGLGLIPGANWLQQELRPWGAGLITLIGSALPLVAIWIYQEQQRRQQG